MSAFAAPLGGSANILAAMARRGMGAGILDQVSPAAPTGTLPPVERVAAPEPVFPAPRWPETQMIVRALENRLKILGEIEKASHGLV